RRRRVTAASPGQRRNHNGDFTALWRFYAPWRAIADFPCCLPQRCILPRFSSLLEGLPSLYLTAWIGRLFRTFSKSLRGQNGEISLRAGRVPGSVGRGGA